MEAFKAKDVDAIMKCYVEDIFCVIPNDGVVKGLGSELCIFPFVSKGYHSLTVFVAVVLPTSGAWVGNMYKSY